MTKNKKPHKQEIVDEVEQGKLIAELAEILVEGFLWPHEHREQEAEKKPIQEEEKAQDEDQSFYL